MNKTNNNKRENETDPVRSDRSLWYMGIGLALVILIMGYLTLFVDDPWSFFSKEKTPVTVVDDKSSLDISSSMNDDEVRVSLVKFIEAFYYDQRRGYFDPPSYFAPLTQTFYNYHNLNYKKLKDIYWQRMSNMQNFSRNWIVSSLEFERSGPKITATYWAKERYFKPSVRQQYAADLKYQMIIDEKGKIESLTVIETRNEAIVQLAPDTILAPPADEFNPDIAAEPSGDNKVYDMAQVEVAPEFNGGQKEFAKFISSNLKYPAQARQNDIQGKVFLSFIVDRDGSITDLKVKQGIGGGCDEEALRIMQSSPKWKPGMVKNTPVKTYCILPLTFQLN